MNNPGTLRNPFQRVRTFLIELELGKVGFSKEGKIKNSKKNFSEQGREPTTTLIRAWHPLLGSIFKVDLGTFK